MPLNEETKELIKDLYLAYVDLNVDKKLGNRAVCTSCFAFSELDPKTNKWSKLQHTDDCTISIMKARVRKTMEA